MSGTEWTVYLDFGFMVTLWGAYHQTEKPHVAVPAQLPPTQGHDRDMGTSPNTAANDEYGGVGLTHDASLLELDLDHDQRWSGLDEARFDRHLVLVELDAVELGVAG